MNQIFRYLIGLCLFLVSSVLLAQSASTTPVGYVKITVKGTGGIGTEAYSYLGVPMHNGAEYQSAMVSAGDNSITARASWDVDAFANTHFVMILSGENEGVSATITGNDAHTLTTAENLNSFLNGDEIFAIYRYNTLADVFGATNEAGLKGSDRAGSADNIFIQNDNDFDIYYYKVGGRGGDGWRSLTSSSADASNTIIPHGTGIIIVRRETTDLEIIVSGSVFPKNVVTPVEEGFNWKTASIPVDLTLAGLFGPDNSAGLVGSDRPGTADNILVFKENGTFETYYYKVGGRGGDGWRNSVSSNIDVADVVIAKPGEMFIINKAVGEPFNLTEKSPLN
jgi:uncharacterized protein (TIGR02597 family)